MSLLGTKPKAWLWDWLCRIRTGSEYTVGQSIQPVVEVSFDQPLRLETVRVTQEATGDQMDVDIDPSGNADLTKHRVIDRVDVLYIQASNPSSYQLIVEMQDANGLVSRFAPEVQTTQDGRVYFRGPFYLQPGDRILLETWTTFVAMTPLAVEVITVLHRAPKESPILIKTL